MKLEIETPTHLIDVNGLGARHDRADAGRRAADRRAGAQHRSRRRCARAARLWRAVARAAGRRVGPAAQQGDDGGQPAPAHALPLFLRHQPALQQAQARQRLRRDRRLFSRQLGVIGTSDACIATHPSDMAVAMRALDATVETVKPDGATRAIPIAEFHRLPGDTPHIETVLDARRADHGGDAAPPVGGTHIYRKVRDRASYAFALVSVAAIVQRDGTRPRGAGRRRAQAVASRGGRGRDAARRQGRRGAACWPARSRPMTTRSSSAGRAHARRGAGTKRGLSHEIRHPRHHQPDRSAQGRRQPHDRIDGPLKTTGMRPTPMSSTMSRRTRPMATSSARPSPRAGSPRSTCARQGAPGVLTDRHRDNAGKLGKGNTTPPSCSAARRSSITIRRSPLVVAETFEQARAARAWSRRL
jgi:xanthine dehydrogenase YagS FAD-binding subunit